MSSPTNTHDVGGAPPQPSITTAQAHANYEGAAATTEGGMSFLDLLRAAIPREPTEVEYSGDIEGDVVTTTPVAFSHARTAFLAATTVGDKRQASASPDSTGNPHASKFRKEDHGVVKNKAAVPNSSRMSAQPRQQIKHAKRAKHAKQRELLSKIWKMHGKHHREFTRKFVSTNRHPAWFLFVKPRYANIL